MARNRTREPQTRKWVGGFAALCLTIGAVQAAAEGNEFEDFRSLTISYSDLDLTKQAGVETLYKRIGWAARAACGPTNLHKYDQFLSSRKAWRECVDRAIARAVADIDEPKLTALHVERTKRVAFG